MKIVHINQETIDCILSGEPVEPIQHGYDNVTSGSKMTSACGIKNLGWITLNVDRGEGLTAIVARTYLGDRQKLHDILEGFPKVNCSKCIEILKKNGL